MGVELKKCKRQVGIVVKSQDKLKQQINRHTNIVTKLQVEILKAAGANQDERARDLIRKRKRFEQTLQQLKRQLNKHKSVSDTIQETVRKIELKIEEARRKKLLLATQRQAYETSKRLTDGLHGEGGNLLEEIDDDVTFLQTETRLALDIDVDRIGLDDFDNQLDEHEHQLLTERYVTEDEELAQLKQRLDDEKDAVQVLPNDEDKKAPAATEDESTEGSVDEQADELTDEPTVDSSEATEEAPEEADVPVEAEDAELAELKRQLAEQGGQVIEAAQQAAEEAQARVDADGPAAEQAKARPATARPRPTRRQRPKAAPAPPQKQEGPLIIDDDGSDSDTGEPDLLIIDDDGSPPNASRKPNRRRRRQRTVEPDIVFIDDND